MLTGKDYPELCPACRLAIDQCAELVPEGPDTDDDEAPCNMAYDMGLLCASNGPSCREEREMGKPKVTWNYTDRSTCEHSSEEACEACEDAGLHMPEVCVTGPVEIEERIGAPFGSMWEHDDGIVYCTAPVQPDLDIGRALERAGFDQTEGT